LEKGGGIHSTVRATRQASLEDLVTSALPRLKSLLGFGVTTAEVKSGYGLDRDTEIKMLEAVNLLDKSQPVRLVPTYLGAHVVPMEYRDKRQEYVDLVINEVIPEVARLGLAKACDVFLDEGAYTLDEASGILKAAVSNGLKAKIHAGQFTDQGGPELIAKMDALSADHLELISDKGIAAMAEAGVVANLLPGAAFSLRDHFPDGRRLIDGGVDVAVATDDNPGTSRTENLPLMAVMAVARMGLTSSEAWKAITVNAAKALGMRDIIGAVVPGRIADLAVFSVPDFRAFLYHFGMNHLKSVVVEGQIVV
jgi:imidazolonepropionase